MLSTLLPALTFLAGLLCKDPEAQPHTTCTQARENFKKVFNHLKQKIVLKPLIFIFLVLIAPGISDALFYFETDVLNFSSDVFGTINTLNACASIAAVWLYRLLFTGVSLRKFLLCTTLALGLT
jgi:Na+/melibiose symporter-like transporter